MKVKDIKNKFRELEDITCELDSMVVDLFHGLDFISKSEEVQNILLGLSTAVDQAVGDAELALDNL